MESANPGRGGSPRAKLEYDPQSLDYSLTRSKGLQHVCFRPGLYQSPAFRARTNLIASRRANIIAQSWCRDGLVLHRYMPGREHVRMPAVYFYEVPVNDSSAHLFDFRRTPWGTQILGL